MDYVKAGVVFNGILRAKEWDPATYSPGAAVRQQISDAVNSAIRMIWGAQKWPMLARVEQRQFRPDWENDVPYSLGHEVLHGDVYWRSKADNNLGHEPADGSDYWERPDDFIPFVDMAQPWEPIAMDSTGVDLDNFAFARDPRLSPNVRAIQGCTFWQNSVVMPAGYAGSTVWVRFIPKAPSVSFVARVNGATYSKYELVYDTAQQSCYKARIDDPGDDVTDTDAWFEIKIPEDFERYIRLQALAEWMQESEGKFGYERAARDELERLTIQFCDASNANTTRMRNGYRRK